MTPTDKAKELFDKMNGYRISYAHRIKCAKVAIDQILNLPSLMEGRMIVVVSEDYKYWTEVKTELDKLAKK